jgi:hypothetical protein
LETAVATEDIFEWIVKDVIPETREWTTEKDLQDVLEKR